jgi:hypothetical protein
LEKISKFKYKVKNILSINFSINKVIKIIGNVKLFDGVRFIVGKKYEIKNENDLIFHLVEVGLVWENLKGKIQISNDIYNYAFIGPSKNEKKSEKEKTKNMESEDNSLICNNNNIEL